MSLSRTVLNNYTSHVLSKNHIKTNQFQIQSHHSQVIILAKKNIVELKASWVIEPLPQIENYT